MSAILLWQLLHLDHCGHRMGPQCVHHKQWHLRHHTGYAPGLYSDTKKSDISNVMKEILMPILDQSSCDTYINGGTGGPSYETVLCIGDGADSKVKSLLEQPAWIASVCKSCLISLVLTLIVFAYLRLAYFACLCLHLLTFAYTLLGLAGPCWPLVGLSGPQRALFLICWLTD